MGGARSLGHQGQTPPSSQINPVIAVLRRSLPPEDQILVDELLEAAAENMRLAENTVGLFTELEIILFVLLVEQQKMIYLLNQQDQGFGEK